MCLFLNLKVSHPCWQDILIFTRCPSSHEFYLTPSLYISPHLSLVCATTAPSLPLSPSHPPVGLELCVCVLRSLSHDLAECSGPGAVMCCGAQSDDGDTCHRSFWISSNLTLSLTLSFTLSPHLFLIYSPLIFFSLHFLSLPNVSMSKHFLNSPHHPSCTYKSMSSQVFCPPFTSNHPLLPFY